MKTAKMILLVGLGLSVSACAAVDAPSRNLPFEALPTTDVTAPSGFEILESTPSTVAALAQIQVPASGAVTQPEQGSLLTMAPGQSPVTVKSIIVRVPQSLKVSEANRYYPSGDIVWRGDPIGNRHLQVQKTFETALLQGVTGLGGPVDVDVDVQIKRFHALTEKARYTVGGVHSITFDLALKNPETGALLVPVRTIRADLDGFGGSQALAAESKGQTQKVRITNHLAEVIRQELTNPQGYENASLGFMQLINGL